ncbi:MAG TPA: type VII secretion-associated protein [Mycobacterium sp.]|nr:type VII secretion-associated protein [Mycobacterium sp.]
MNAHRTVIEVGPSEIRRLCCGAAQSANIDDDAVQAALDCIDDPVALVGGRPVAVAALWTDLLRSAACPDRGSHLNPVLIVHPSWWPETRIEVVATAARTMAGQRGTVVIRSRASFLAGTEATVVVEIAARLVAVTVVGTVTESVAEPRLGSPEQVADAVLRRVVGLTGGAANAIWVDGPTGVGGAAALAGMIAERLRGVRPGGDVELVDRARLVMLGSAPGVAPGVQQQRAGRRSRVAALAASVALLAATAAGVGSRIGNGPPVVPAPAPATFLVEGRVAIQVPADWPVRRVTGGRGSARVEVTSPADPRVVLHLTQSVAPGATLQATGESLRLVMDRANAAEPPGVFVDFNPAGNSAGRAAVTYRERRGGRNIDWSVLVDEPVRISIGCQSPEDGGDPAGAARAVCEQAVRSARALG